MPHAVLDRDFIRDLFHHSEEVGQHLIEHPRTGMLMVLVPAGRFLAGTHGGAPFEVDLTAYYVAVHPVTNAQYFRFVAETGYRKPENTEWGRPVGTNGAIPQGKANHPVVFVSLHDATAYCQWAGLRLPTELEWQKAASGLDGRAFPWGKNWDPKRCRNFVNKGDEKTASGWRYGLGGSPFGVLQLSGNVWEWCDDGVARGGSWDLGGPPAPRSFYGDPWANGRSHLAQVPYDGNDFSCRVGCLRPFASSCGFRCVGEVGVSP